MLHLFLNALITVVLEAIVAFLLHFKSKDDQIYIALINVITNVSLTLILTLISLYLNNIYAYTAIVIFLELIIVIIEYLLYKKLLSNDGNKLSLAIIGNIVSCLIGLLIIYLLGF